MTKTREPSYQNLLNFLRLSFLILLYSSAFSERKSPDGSRYLVSLINNFSFSNAGGLPFVDWLPDAILQSTSYLFVMQLVLPMGLLYGFFFPESRLGYTAGFIRLLLGSLFNHLLVSVLATIYLVPLFILIVQPPRQERENMVRSNLVMAFSLMYLLSALAKANMHFISGEVLGNATFQGLLRTPLEGLGTTAQEYRIASIGGWALQIIAGLMWLGRSRKAALLASLAFHLVVCVMISWSHNLLFFGASLPLLFDRQTQSKSYYKYVLSLVVCTPLLLFSVSGLNSRLTYDLASVGLALLIAVPCFAKILRMQARENYQSAIGTGIPVLYYLVALLLAWPEPFGYSQYAGRNLVYFGVMVAHDQVVLPPNRWSVRSHETRDFVAEYLPTEGMRNVYLSRSCRLNPKLRFVVFNTADMFPMHKDLESEARKFANGSSQDCAGKTISN